MGRPPRAGGPASMVSVRLTPAERESYAAAAASESLTLAEWMRVACAEWLKRHW
jgi:hypothetical protein